MNKSYHCYACGKQYNLMDRVFRCSCGSFLIVDCIKNLSTRSFSNRDHSIWNYRTTFCLPPGVTPVTLGEGHTPVYRTSVDGIPLMFKLDYLQPTGSFKDRGASVLVSLVKWMGINKIVEDSSGNAGASIAAYASASGIECTIYVPEYAPDGKTTPVLLYGAKVKKIRGTRQDVSNAVIEASSRSFYASHAWNPFFMIGLTSSAFEIWQDIQPKLPDQIILPVGGGNYLEALFRGFKTLFDNGLSSTIPRLVGAQAENCAPLYYYYESGLDDFYGIKTKKTIAEGISVQQPPRARAVIDAVKKSNGTIITVSEKEIIDALKISAKMGLFIEATSACALAGWKKLPRAQKSNSLIILTGHGLKEIHKLKNLLLDSSHVTTK